MLRSWHIRQLSFTVAVALLLGGLSPGEQLSPKDFKDVKSPKEALEVVQERLKQDGKPEYAALLSEARVREAIRTGITSYEATLESQEKRNPGSKNYFEKEVKPVFLKVADKDEWPEGCSFFSFYTLTDEHRVAYDGLGLRLQIETPKSKFKGFALPVVDLYFGRIFSHKD